MKVRVRVTPRAGILDPQGRAIQNALAALGFAHVGDVRQGKLIEFDIQATSRDDARRAVEDMCKRLLANPVIEDYAIEIDE